MYEKLHWKCRMCFENKKMVEYTYYMKQREYVTKIITLVF